MIHIGYAILGMFVAAFLGFLCACLLDEIALQLVDLRRRLVQECDSTKHWIDNYRELHAEWRAAEATWKRLKAGDDD